MALSRVSKDKEQASPDRTPDRSTGNSAENPTQSSSDRQDSARADDRAVQENDHPDAANSTESVLVAQAKENPDAFGVIYERYADRIYAYVFNRVRNIQDAEDLTARTFYRALSRLHTYEDRGLPFAAWLFRIAHNLVANWYRDNSKRRFISLENLRLPGRKRTEPEVVVEQSAEEEALWDAIERLPEDRRDLLLYKFGSKLSNLEIGDVMGRSEGAIKSLYFRTLAALRSDLQARHWGPERKANDDEE